HDYIKEFGGAERVLKTLTEIYPEAPIYTAFRVKGSTADKEFKGKKIIESWLAPILKIWRLYSPLRFLAPLIWRSFDLSEFDLVITSSSWYITRGFKVGKNTKVACYCHTPPRWLYGYETSVGFTKYWPVKIYAAIVGHFMRMYDYKTAQEVDFFIANSKNVQARIEKFYRRDSTVIYPPIEVEKITKATKNLKKSDFYFIASRQVGAKGINEATEIFKKLNKKLYIVGEGWGTERLTDLKLYKTYAQAKAFIALARDEDFGMTVVEAQATGTPVIAFNGGGFKESVIEGVNGVLIDGVSEESIKKAIEKVGKIKWDREKIVTTSKKFSKDRFKKEMLQFIAMKTGGGIKSTMDS
ncbi:MAG: glycosyltransferase, partial [Patescibacteria group bacterium]